MAEKDRKGPKRTKTGGRDWKPGQSGNPAGRPKDQEYRQALELLKAKSPELMQKAIDMALCDKPSEKVIVAFLGKICPERLSLEPENPLRIILEQYSPDEK